MFDPVSPGNVCEQTHPRQRSNINAAYRYSPQMAHLVRAMNTESSSCADFWKEHDKNGVSVVVVVRTSFNEWEARTTR